MARDDAEIGAWLDVILGEWHRIRATRPGLGRLRPPNLQVKPLQATLGRWDPGRRLITLSEQLLEPARWQALVDTLRHEVAHQVVSELFGRGHERPHGDAFREACRLVGCEAEARAPADVLDGRPQPVDRVRARVMKLLALGQSSNRHEAELALARAHALCLKYNLDLVDGRRDARYARRLVTRPRKRTPAHYWSVLGIVGEYWFVQYIARSTHDRRGGTLRVIELYGTQTNLDLAEYVFHFLIHQGEAAWREFKAARDLRGVAQRRSFLSGLYAGFRQKLERERETLATTQALVWRGDPGLDTFFQGLNPSVRTRRLKGSHHAGAHAAGREVGSALVIRPGVGAADDGVAGHLE